MLLCRNWVSAAVESMCSARRVSAVMANNSVPSIEIKYTTAMKTGMSLSVVCLTHGSYTKCRVSSGLTILTYHQG